ncbi:MAG: RDD family protein [Ginsengibacter sp.]
MEEEYPHLIDRIQSTFIDTILIVILMFLFSTILDRIANPSDWIRIVMFFGIWFVYEPLCITLGFTLGNYIKGIRVRQFGDTSKRINIFQSLIRYIFKLLLGWVSFLTINGNTKRRAIHDFIAGSVMINYQPKKNFNAMSNV